MSEPTATYVLLVDAFLDEGDMYAEYLRMCGFRTKVCRAPEDAVEDATRHPPDVVVTRLRQAGPLTGIGLVQRLKAHKTTENVPVVMITTSWHAEDRDAALQAGCDSYLLLPVLPDALAAELRRVLASKELRDVHLRAVTGRPKTSTSDRRGA